jgi:hypothetical protein
MRLEYWKVILHYVWQFDDEELCSYVLVHSRFVFCWPSFNIGRLEAQSLSEMIPFMSRKICHGRLGTIAVEAVTLFKVPAFVLKS